MQEVIQDSTVVPPDSISATVADTLGVTRSVVEELSRDVAETGRLFIRGDWNMLMGDISRNLTALISDFVPRLIGAFFVFLFFYIAYRLIRSLLHKVLAKSRKVDTGLENLTMKTFNIVALTMIVVSVLGQFGINVSALLAGLSIAGIAVGFAAKDTLENFISGVTIMMDRPFKVGDFIEVDGTYGRVEEITLRSTRLWTRANEIMVMPNLQMVNQKMINHSSSGILRISVPFGIAYKEFPQQAREVVLKLTEGDERLHPSRKPEVVVTALNNSSVDMELRLFLKNPKDELPILFEYVEKVREALRTADIEIPFPHLQLFVDEAKALENSFLMQPKFSDNEEVQKRKE